MEPSTSLPQHTNPTAFSNFVGAAFAGQIEQLCLHWLDTLAKIAMLGNSAWLNFRHELMAASLRDKIRRIHVGISAALLKKGAQRTYQWGTQRTIEEMLHHHYGSTLQGQFGSNAPLLERLLSAGATGLLESFFIQGIDTAQVVAQLKNQSWITVIRERGFSIWYGWRFVAFGRNIPGAITLFTTEKWVNQSFENQNQTNTYIDFLAKLSGSIACIIITQPGDVIKVTMQKEKLSAREAIKRLSIKQMCTNGLIQRLPLSLKVAFGFFFADKCMKQSQEILGKPSNELIDASLPTVPFTWRFEHEKRKSRKPLPFIEEGNEKNQRKYEGRP